MTETRGRRTFDGLAGCAGGKDCFVPHSAIQADGFRTLAQGERVKFDIVDGTKGPAAENVVKV